MLGGADPVQRLEIWASDLKAFSLAWRIENQRDVALPDEAFRVGPIRAAGLPRRGMAAGPEHAREWSRAIRRQIEVRGDRKARTAVEDDVLDLIAVALVNRGDPGIERRSFRKRSEALRDPDPDIANIALRVGTVRRAAPGIGSLLDFPHAADVVFVNFPWEAIVGRGDRGVCCRIRGRRS